MINSIRVGDVGTSFVIRVVTVDENGVKSAVDISSASTLKMFFKKPNGTVLEKTANLNTDGKDGRMKYILSDGDIDISGKWKVQGYVDLGGSGSWYTSAEEFIVEENLA